MNKFNKRQLGVLGFGVLAMVVVCGFAALSISAENSDPTFCGKSNKVLFGFNDEHHTQFSIPEAYLYDPFHIVHKVKDPADLISLRVRKTDLKPACSDEVRGLDDGKLITININQHLKNDFAHLLAVSQSFHSIPAGEIGDQYSLYKMRANLSGELFIPKNEEARKSFFLICNHPSTLTTQEALKSCGATINITDTIHASYIVENISLEEIQKLNEDIKNLLLGFFAKSDTGGKLE